MPLSVIVSTLEAAGADEMAASIRAEVYRLRQESKRYRLELRAAEEQLARLQRRRRTRAGEEVT